MSTPRVIDHTLPLAPGQRGVTMEPKLSVERDGWNVATWHVYSHAGTQMGAQLHFAAGPETIDTKPLSHRMGPAWVVDLTRTAPRALLTVAHLGPLAKNFPFGQSLLLPTNCPTHAAAMPPAQNPEPVMITLRGRASASSQ